MLWFIDLWFKLLINKFVCFICDTLSAFITIFVQIIDVLSIVINVLSGIPINKDSKESFVQRFVIFYVKYGPFFQLFSVLHYIQLCPRTYVLWKQFKRLHFTVFYVGWIQSYYLFWTISLKLKVRLSLNRKTSIQLW